MATAPSLRSPKSFFRILLKRSRRLSPMTLKRKKPIQLNSLIYSFFVCLTSTKKLIQRHDILCFSLNGIGSAIRFTSYTRQLSSYLTIQTLEFRSISLKTIRNKTFVGHYVFKFPKCKGQIKNLIEAYTTKRAKINNQKSDVIYTVKSGKIYT